LFLRTFGKRPAERAAAPPTADHGADHSTFIQKRKAKSADIDNAVSGGTGPA
jgi:hypothetical protein